MLGVAGRFARFLLTVGCATSIGAAAVEAQCCDGPSLPPGFTAYPLGPTGPWQWTTLREFADGEAARNGDAGVWGAYAGGIGRGWRVMFHPVLGTPTWILTDGLDLGSGSIVTDAAAVARMRRFVDEHRALLGVDRVDALKLMRVSVTPNAHGQDILGVDFKQTYRGYDVRTPTDHIRVKLHANATLGRLVAFGSDWLTGLEVEVRPIDRAAAITRALEEVPDAPPGTVRIHDVETFVLVEARERAEHGIDAKLVHQVKVETTSPLGAWSVILDANTGVLLRKHSDVVHLGDGGTPVRGNVAAGTLDDGPLGSFSIVPMQSLHVHVVGGGSAATDANGDFTIAHAGTAAVRIAGRFEGDWCEVINNRGPNLNFVLPAFPGTPINIVMNPQNTMEFPTAEATAYRFTTATRFFLAKRIPRFTGLAKLTAHVNESVFSCSAMFINGTITFFMRGTRSSLCANTAFEEVIAHEYGHAFHDWFHGSTKPLDFSEGIADHIALYLSDQRVIGRDYNGAGVHLRDYTKPVSQPSGAMDRQFNDPSCLNQTHCLGMAWAGFCADLRDLLIKKHGAVQGRDVSEVITIAPYDRNPADMIAGMLGVFIQDDSDANLSNGTPNFHEIAEAADVHSLPRPSNPQDVQITHVPATDTRDTVNPRSITATITSQAGNVTGAWLVYKVDSGGYSSLAMPRGTGNAYSAMIPPQSAVSRVSYHIVATDDRQQSGRTPTAGDYRFTVGRSMLLFVDDFESDKGWVAGQNTSAGRFERADPIRFTLAVGRRTFEVQPEDDATPGAGTHCFVTENGNRQSAQQPDLYDVDGGFVEIRSPLVDLSAVAVGTAELRYSRYFFTYNNSDDELWVDVSSDAGASWTRVETVRGRSNRWSRVQLNLPGPYTNRMVVRFRTEDDPNNSVTDAAIDDVAIVAFDDDVAALRSSTASPRIGTAVRYTVDAARRANGTCFFAISAGRGPTRIPGVGVLDLGVPFFVVWQGVLDSAGHGTLAIPIPNAAALKGVTIHAQAVAHRGDLVVSNPCAVQVQ